jgi:peptidoglycan/LPS O-acetylase OafA/YrhL
MSSQDSSAVDERFLATGDESGTAPGDRRFRPDVEGLRAVAVLLVVLYHAAVPGLTGGYVGVDVFFVISGFVITGLLLRERSRTNHTSILDFYARRCRRILPAATLVLLVAVFSSYVVLGVVSGNSTADDGRWAAVFLANFHFESIGTNYRSRSSSTSCTRRCSWWWRGYEGDCPSEGAWRCVSASSLWLRTACRSSRQPRIRAWRTSRH